jgi:curved DNA-binding protein
MPIATSDLYRTLGLKRSATTDEIRRAFRILARRYHPDVNPGASSSEKFAAISEAYQVLIDPTLKRAYDGELETSSNFARAEQRAREYAANQARADASRKAPPNGSTSKGRSTSAAKPRSPNGPIATAFRRSKELAQFVATSLFKRSRSRSLVVVEVSVSMREALNGAKKSVELPGDTPGRPRKISLNIPPGSRNGSILQLRSKQSERDEVLVIFRVAPHPWIAVEARGVVASLTLSLQEALSGATVIVPTFDEQVGLRIPPNTSSGQEFRLRGKGVFYLDGTRGDLFFKTEIKLPQDAAAAESLTRSIADLPREKELRAYFPKGLGEVP